MEQQAISRKGRRRTVRLLPLALHTKVVLKGRLLRIGEIFDEFWIPSKDMLALPEIVEALRRRPGRPDILISTQKLPHLAPRYAYYHEWTNLAVVQFASYQDWHDRQIDRNARYDIRKSVREGIRAEIVRFDDELVKGICSIYNELPIRQGRSFWHYGKDPETVKAENVTYLERSVFIGAFFERELVGFIKMVLDDEVASFMQILSKSAFFGKRPNYALVAKAIEICAERGIRYLTYGQYAYGKKDLSSLIEFKKNLDFKRVDLPRYYVPLTVWGSLGLKAGWHRGISILVPEFLSASCIRARSTLVKLRSRRP